MKNIGEAIPKKFGNYPERVLQIGEGNFLRAFVDWMIDMANREGVYEGSIVLCQPIAPGMSDVINAQNGLYTVAMRGMEAGQRVERMETITSVSRCLNPYKDYAALLEVARSPELQVVVSNTTEAGIAYHAGDKCSDTPPTSFPAKVTALLYERYTAFNGDPAKGLLFLPVELIDNNGAELHRIVLQYAHEWALGDAFINWIETACEFASTLVDRIVTGYPRDELDYFADKLGYEDQLIDTCEVFNLWVIQADRKWADVLPIAKTSAHVIWTDDVTPYKKRKVRILNGAHTSTVLSAYLAGCDIVLDFMHDDVIAGYMHSVIFDEIIPTLDLPRDELVEFANAVADRFSNPFIKHKLLDIALNSQSKFAARCLPSLLGYVEAKGELPKRLTFALAAFLRFYRCRAVDGKYVGRRADGTEYQLRDDAEVLEFYEEIWSTGDAARVVHAALGNVGLWSGRDLRLVPELEAAVRAHLRAMDEHSMRELMQAL